jgi:hypothetical protein
MESKHRRMKMLFWEIVDANWTVEEQNDLARLWKAFEDANHTRL